MGLSEQKVDSLFLDTWDQPRIQAEIDAHSKIVEDEKKARVARSVSYLKHQKTLDDWGSESFTAIDAAISAADTFTG